MWEKSKLPSALLSAPVHADATDRERVFWTRVLSVFFPEIGFTNKHRIIPMQLVSGESTRHTNR